MWRRCRCKMQGAAATGSPPSHAGVIAQVMKYHISNHMHIAFEGIFGVLQSPQFAHIHPVSRSATARGFHTSCHNLHQLYSLVSLERLSCVQKVACLITLPLQTYIIDQAHEALYCGLQYFQSCFSSSCIMLTHKQSNPT